MSDNNEALAEQLAAKHYKAMCAKELGHLSTIDTIASAVREALAQAQPSGYSAADMSTAAADGFRDGQRVAELQAKAVPDGWKLVPLKAADWLQQHDAAFNLCSEFGEEFTRSNRDFALRAYEWLVKFSPAAPAPAASPVVMNTEDVALAYGVMWHVNAGLDAPVGAVRLSLSPEKACHIARGLLRDKLTHEQRGDGINKAVELLAGKSESPSADLSGSDGK